jgi:protein-disulfide isomerase
VAYADQLGLAQPQFTHCLSSFAHQVAVDSAVQSGLDRGVTGTPTFFLNGQVVGNDYATLERAIEQQLAIGKDS